MSIECDYLIANDASQVVDWKILNKVYIHHTLFGSCDKEDLKLMHIEKPTEVHIVAIHDVKSASLDLQDVEDAHFCQFPVADMDKCRNIAS